MQSRPRDPVPLKPSARNYRPQSAPLLKPTPANIVGAISAENDFSEGARFAVAQKDSLFVPFGKFQHPKGLQLFDKESASIIRAAFNDGVIRSEGVPIYRGHPDVPGRPDSNPAAPAVGWVKSIDVEPTGARVAVRWGADGERAIANAEFRFYSPNWLLRTVKGGIQPVKLLSIGLTNNPRIPVPAIANDAHGDSGADRRHSIVASIQRHARCGHESAWAMAALQHPALFNSTAAQVPELKAANAREQNAKAERLKEMRSLIASIQASARCDYTAAFNLAHGRRPDLFV